MARKTCYCAMCENSNLPSICTACVNYRLNDYHLSLKSLKGIRDSLYARLNEQIMAKSKVDNQLNWRVLQNEKLTKLKERLHLREKQLLQGKAKLAKISGDLRVRYGLLESAFITLEKNRAEKLGKFYPNLIYTHNLGHTAITSERVHIQAVIMKQICRLFPQRQVNLDGEMKDGSGGQYDQICNARFPRGLDPHSVPSEELAASLGYMVQLVNLAAHSLAAPVLHNSGFAGSCSRIWQRNSYWDARPASRSIEYSLFIPRQNCCSIIGENSWSDRSCSNFGVASMESGKKPQFGDMGRNSFNCSCASPHSAEDQKDLQKGISLLKKSVACITTYSYNSLYLDVPTNLSTFEAFAKLLSTLSYSKEVRSVFSSKMACSRTPKQVQHLNRSVSHEQYLGNSVISSSSLVESAHTPVMLGTCCNNLSNCDTCFLFATEMADNGKSESLIEGWDIVEHPTLPPPSQAEDIEHWTRAMFIDATGR